MENVNKPSSGLKNFTILLVILLLGAGFFLYKLNAQNSELKNSNSDLQTKSKTNDSILNKIADEQKIISDSNVAVVNLVGTKPAVRTPANVYWDSTSSKVYLVVKNMPQLPSDKQYQLWALIDGKPSDLGVFDAKSDKMILKMKDTHKADAFAITIEKKGGNYSPALETLQAMGKTKNL
ncbi:anti-sigma factor domain-containing protein [Chitinophagaceae bacterium LWZ2-11]